MQNRLARLTYLGLDLGFGLPPLLVFAHLAHAKRRREPNFQRVLVLSTALSLAYAAFAERGARRQALWQASRERSTGPELGGTVWEEWLSLAEMSLGIGLLTLVLERRHQSS